MLEHQLVEVQNRSVALVYLDLRSAIVTFAPAVHQHCWYDCYCAGTVVGSDDCVDTDLGDDGDDDEIVPHVHTFAVVHDAAMAHSERQQQPRKHNAVAVVQLKHRRLKIVALALTAVLRSAAAGKHSSCVGRLYRYLSRRCPPGAARKRAEAT